MPAFPRLGKSKRSISELGKTWRTPAVRIRNTRAGKAGRWFCQIGGQQAFGHFEVSAILPAGDYVAPDLPSPQDWLLVLERQGTS